MDILNARAGGEGFAKLVRLCLVTPKENGERYTLHSVIKDLTLKRIDKSNHDLSSDHEAIADAWLAQLKISSHPSPPNIRMANAAFYHLSEGDCYLRLHELSERLLSKDIIYSLYDIQKQQRDKGNVESAIAALKLILRLDGNEHKAHRFLADCIEQFYGRGNTEALEHFRKAYELDPAYAHYLNGLGRCLLARDEPAAFVAIVDNLDETTFDRTMSDNHNRALFATCLEKIGRGQEASKLRRTRIDKGSSNPIFYSGEANYLNDQGNHEGALEILQKAENKGITDKYILNIKAKVLQSMGKDLEASKIRQEQIAIGSRHSAFYSDEALCLNDQGDREGALKILGKAESLGCADEYIFAIKIKVLTSMGRENDASSLRREQINKGSRHAFFYHDEAKDLSKQGKNNEALAILLNAENAGCIDDYTFAIKASVLQALGRNSEASNLRSKYINKGSRNVAYYNDEAKYLYEQGDSGGALSILQKAEELRCADAYSLVTKAVVLEALGRGTEASILRMEQIDKGIKDAAFYNDEATYQRDHGKYEAAFEVIHKAETACCLDEYTLAIKASVLEALGKESEASNIRREQIDKGSANPAFYTDEAKHLSLQGNHKGAVEVLLIAEKKGFATEYTSALKASLIKAIGRKE